MKVTYRYHPEDKAAPDATPSLPLAIHQPTEVAHAGSTLWAAFVQGDESAYAQLYKCYFHELYNYGVKLCQQPDLVKDCIHDLFIDLWKSRKKPPRVVAIRPYLYKALRNIIMKVQTRKPMFQAVDLAYHAEQEPSSEATMIIHQASQEQQQRLQAALSTLTQRQREVIFLRFYSQLSYDEVASVLKISTKATYKLMGRAIALLRQKMIPLMLLASYLF